MHMWYWYFVTDECFNMVCNAETVKGTFGTCELVSYDEKVILYGFIF